MAKKRNQGVIGNIVNSPKRCGYCVRFERASASAGRCGLTEELMNSLSVCDKFYGTPEQPLAKGKQ